MSPIVEPDAIHLVVLTGMAGGGKTVALRALGTSSSIASTTCRRS